VAAWEGAGQPLEPGAVSVEPGDMEVRPGGMPVLDAGGAADLARTGVLLDARTPVRYRGEHEPIDPVAGHIPGAVNVPYAELVDATGRLLPPEQLRAVLPSGPVVGAYCGSGVTAAHTVLALEVAGLAPASLYVGSWSDWIRDPARPVATGDHP
jgi:thiosulfate/3-mercaptopyruvate sulfurtransferase